MRPIFIPWSLAEYTNGVHPLLAVYLQTLQHTCQVVTPSVNVPFTASSFTRDHISQLEELYARFSGDRNSLCEFISTRHHLSDLAAPMNSLVFHHTLIPTLRHTSMVHFENPIMFFWPSVKHGHFSEGSSLLDHPFYQAIKETLSHLKIKKIISHSALGLSSLYRLFPDEDIREKTEQVPLLPFVQLYVDDIRRSAGQCPGPKEDERHILFTNSFHGYAESFWLRGGVTTLLAYSLVKKHIPLRLTIVSKIPQNLPTEITDLLSDPQIHLQERVSETELQRLYDAADVFMLPSICLHSMSLARAVCSGTYVISADAPGADEVITDSLKGYIVPGTATTGVYFKDQKVDMWLDNFSNIQQINYDNAVPVATALYQSLRSPTQRRRSHYQPTDSDREAVRRLHSMFVGLCQD